MASSEPTVRWSREPSFHPAVCRVPNRGIALAKYVHAEDPSPESENVRHCNYSIVLQKQIKASSYHRNILVAQQQMRRNVVHHAALVQRFELELAVFVLLVLVHCANRSHPVTAHALDLAQPMSPERSHLTLETHLGDLAELVQLGTFLDLFAGLFPVGVLPRVRQRRNVASVLVKVSWGLVGGSISIRIEPTLCCLMRKAVKS